MARNRSPSAGMDPSMRRSDSPLYQPQQSKRDKRRAVMTEKLQEIVDSFNHHLRPHYEAQINAIQVDISLILRANPYENKPLDDSPEDIDEHIRGVVGDKIPADPVAEADFRASAGKLYAEYARKVNDAMEERDINLNVLLMKHQNSLHQLQQRHQFQVRLAKEEHKLLSESIRERLVTTLTKRRERLLKEKEQLDIGDSNALLLHPNQFSLMNPSSPGGPHKRHTRGRGIKGGADADDSSGVVEKRKKILFDEDPQPSPALGPSRFDAGNSTPYQLNRSKNSFHQHEASAYSIDRLFTEKELQLTMNRAATAAQNFLIKLKGSKDGRNGVNSDEDESATVPENGADGNTAKEGAGEDEGIIAATGPAAAPEMERSHSHHQTRGVTRNNDKENMQLPLSASESFPIRATLPTYIPAIMGAKANNAPVSATPLSQADVESDLMLMSRNTDGNDEYNNQLLERASEPVPFVEYRYGPPGLASDAPHTESLPLPVPPNLGGVAMSKTNSDMGPAMSRTSSSMGLKRTASSSHLGEVGGRRVRSRF